MQMNRSFCTNAKICVLVHVDDYQYNDLKGLHSACFALKSSKERLLLFTYLIYNFSDNITKCKSNSL